MNIREVRRHGDGWGVLSVRRQLLSSAHAIFLLIRVAARCGREAKTGESARRTLSSLGTIPAGARGRVH